MKKILIGVLASGEQEKEEALASIRLQKFDSFDVEVFEGLGNKESHDALYDLFNRSAEKYEFFLKHDADMVFSSRTALSTIYRMISLKPGIQMMMMDVMDWLSGQLIPGQNVYRNTVRWTGNEDDLIVDYHGTSKGSSLRIRDYPVPLVVHSPNPSPFQAFTFGLHRAQKILQRGRERNMARALLHYTILANIWSQWQLKGDVRRLYALIGAKTTLERPDIVLDGEYKSAHVLEYFSRQILIRSVAALEHELRADWGRAVLNQERWLFERTRVA